ncbi:MAG: hypothetical protein JXA68_04930 [Ignavibacteriales bacterium]|nr:hypothetical protein [Ignavibacteriales bacterium]
MKTKTIFAILLSFLLFYCTDKFELPQEPIDRGTGNVSDTVYIQQNPLWTGFNKPQDMIIGKETFIYVCDTDNDRIVMMNMAGQILGTKYIKHPIAIDQDYQLNLIVCAQFDTLIGGTQQTLSAVYKIDLFSAGHQIGNAPMTRILPKTSFDFLKVNREYSGVCVFKNNSFYIARRGPNNTDKIDPDNAILVYEKKTRSNGVVVDTLTTKLPLLAPEGTGLLSMNQISSLTSFDNDTKNFIITLIGLNYFKVQWLEYVSRTDFEGYQSKLSTVETDMMISDRFDQPEDVCIDKSGKIYVADAGRDSVYVFNTFGDELQSFGGANVFNDPHAVAFFDKTLYVLDTGNDRIVRFILSTEIK